MMRGRCLEMTPDQFGMGGLTLGDLAPELSCLTEKRQLASTGKVQAFDIFMAC